jgi:hypothetical protein
MNAFLDTCGVRGEAALEIGRIGTSVAPTMSLR